MDRETEFRGVDIIKHGEAAYPVTAWREIQYNESSSFKNSKSLPSFIAHNITEDVNQSADTVNTSKNKSEIFRINESPNNGVENVAMEKFE